MDNGTFLIVGGSSGIGFEIVNALLNQGDEIHVASRTRGKLAGIGGVHHLQLDVKKPPDHLEGLPDVLHGVVYCPDTIRLKPFQRLTREDFLEDLRINFFQIFLRGTQHVVSAEPS
jgi:3-oxoacyl-[acyl-carrier protein] reductase